MSDGKNEIRFLADNGELTLTIDAKTHFFSAVSFQIRPPGAPEGALVRVRGTFSPQVLKESESLIFFIPGARSAVENLTDLTSTRVALGSEAVDLTSKGSTEKRSLYAISGARLWSSIFGPRGACHVGPP